MEDKEMERNFIGHLIESVCNTMNKTSGFMNVLSAVFIGLVLVLITLNIINSCARWN